jgi:hypothetical protein
MWRRYRTQQVSPMARLCNKLNEEGKSMAQLVATAGNGQTRSGHLQTQCLRRCSSVPEKNFDAGL